MPLKSCKSIAFALHLDCTMIESIIKDYGLFENDGENFWSNSANTRMKKRTAIVENGKPPPQVVGAQPQISKCNAKMMQMQCKPMQKKRKEKKINLYLTI